MGVWGFFTQRYPGKQQRPPGALLPMCLSGKESACQCRRRRRHKRLGFDSRVRKIPWRRKCKLAPVFLPGTFHRQRSLVGYSPRGCKESDMTKHTHALGVLLSLMRGFLAISHFLEYERVRGCLNLQVEFNLINTK